MSQKSIGIHVTILLTVSAFLSLTWGSAAFSQYDPAWDSRYEDALKFCVNRPQSNQECVQVVDGNPMKVSSIAAQITYKASSASLGLIAGEGSRLLSKAIAPAYGDKSPYWKRVHQRKNYEALRNHARYQSDKQGLESCQRACMATCISAKLLEYDDRNTITNWREALEREKGVCREFSGLAVNLMKHLGVRATVVTGKAYDVSEQRDPVFQEGHVMVLVTLPSGDYIMEPQSNACEFFDKKFTMGKRKFERKSLNLKEI